MTKGGGYRPVCSEAERDGDSTNPSTLEEQLGLKMEATRASVNVLVIDNVQHATESQ